MAKRLFGAGLALLVVASGAFAASGNARVDALSHPTILDDISATQYNPAYMNDYKDQVQLSIGGPGIGPGIGIKGLGNFAVGVLAKNEWTLQRGFYGAADAAVGIRTGVLSPANVPSNIPHLLLGADLGAFKLGVDLFYELGHSSEHILNTTVAGKTVTDAVIAIRNPGFIVGGNMGLGDAGLNLKAGFTAPGITSEFKTVDSNTTITTTRNSYGLHGIVGGRVTLPVMGAAMTGGVDFEGQMYKFEEHRKTAALDTIDKGSYDKMSDISVDLYIGAQKVIMDQLRVGAEYHLVYTGSSVTPDSVGYANRITDSTLLQNSITGFAEKKWASVLFLDSLQARIGATYAASTPMNGASSGGKKGDDQYLRGTKGYTTWELTPALGLGFRKGVFQFDTYIEPTALLNVFKLVNGTYGVAAGTNDIFRATLTLDLGNPAQSSSSSSSSTPSYSPATTEQSAPAPYTPATESEPIPTLGQ